MEMIQKWFSDFRWYFTSADITERSGRSKHVSNHEKVEKIHDVMLNNPKIDFFELAEATTMSFGSLFSIKHNNFSMKRITRNSCRVC